MYSALDERVPKLLPLYNVYAATAYRIYRILLMAILYTV